MDNIFIDTSFFIKHNFLEGPVVKSMLDLSKNGMVKIYISEIVFQELVNNFTEDFDYVKQQLQSKRFSSISNSKYKENINTLKNAENYREDFSTELRKVFLLHDVEIIKTHHANITNVVDDYFNKRLPFTNRKKYEFPDAINLSLIKNYFEEKQECCYLFSVDNDFKELDNKYVKIQDKETIETYFSDMYKILLTRRSEILNNVEEELNKGIIKLKHYINKYLVDFPFDEESLEMIISKNISFYDFINYDIQKHEIVLTFNDETGLYLDLKVSGTFIFDFFKPTHNESEPYRQYTCILNDFPMRLQFQVYFMDDDNKYFFYRVTSINNDDHLGFWEAENIQVMVQS